MLKIFFGEMENAVYNTSLYFKNRFNPRWMEDDRTVKMIKDVDKSEVLGNGAVSSPVMGIIAPVSLSGGVKTLILIDQINDKVFNASNCGDNCARWLLEIGREKDNRMYWTDKFQFIDRRTGVNGFYTVSAGS